MRHRRSHGARWTTALQLLTRRWRERRSLDRMEDHPTTARAAQPCHVRLVETDDAATLDQLLLRAAPGRREPGQLDAGVSPRWDGGRATG